MRVECLELAAAARCCIEALSADLKVDRSRLPPDEEPRPVRLLLDADRLLELAVSSEEFAGNALKRVCGSTCSNSDISVQFEIKLLYIVKFNLMHTSNSKAFY